MDKIRYGTMVLENYYYKLISMQSNGLSGMFHIALCPDCDVYRGHFPDNPVSPGVCNIQTVKECAEKLTGQPLQVSSIRRCRLTAVITPATCPEMDIKINMTPTESGYDITSTISDTERTYMELKGEMTV
ncbi:MAG: beta-hydroxyacyl-ACP dehydratase [Prevotella sp.]|nr:beta-hydroxyacyl-ACP dehydratase [Prevotella sp.]